MVSSWFRDNLVVLDIDEAAKINKVIAFKKDSELAAELEEQAKAEGGEIYQPSDLACGDEFPAGGSEETFKVVPSEEVQDGQPGRPVLTAIPRLRLWRALFFSNC